MIYFSFETEDIIKVRVGTAYHESETQRPLPPLGTLLSNNTLKLQFSLFVVGIKISQARIQHCGPYFMLLLQIIYNM